MAKSGGNYARRRGASYENEVVGWLRANGQPATKISSMYKTGPDLQAFDGRFVECRRRKGTYESVNKIVEELDGDASLYFTRLDGNNGDHVVVLYASTLLDLIGE